MSGETTVEERILGYGQRAVAGGTRVAQAPAKKGGGAAPKVPAHVERARNLWAAHFAHEPGRGKVVIHDIADAPSRLVATSDFKAWTNSATAIYVHPDAATNHATLLVVLHHENVHIGQFRDEKVSWPKDHAAMMRYECVAYGSSATFTAGSSDAAVRAYTSDMAASRDLFCNKIAAVAKDVADGKVAAKDVNEVFRTFLVDEEKMLPGHTKIEELYRP